jgi:hypothetical protein
MYPLHSNNLAFPPKRTRGPGRVTRTESPNVTEGSNGNYLENFPTIWRNLPESRIENNNTSESRQVLKTADLLLRYETRGGCFSPLDIHLFNQHRRDSLAISADRRSSPCTTTRMCFPLLSFTIKKTSTRRLFDGRRSREEMNPIVRIRIEKVARETSASTLHVR